MAMKLKSVLISTTTHLFALGFGFALGIYMLPILIAPASPSVSDVEQASATAQYSATFQKDLQDSDAFHWGEGRVTIGAQHITFRGELAPGPDYKLYLSPQFVETEAEFKRLKSSMVRVGDIKTFDAFVIDIPSQVDVSQYQAVIIWCETFGEFITAAKYR